ncbi:MAG TPA: iron-sulfur cluster insertion protein ErpA [Acetobacteraceae bacterium]|jgi:iron-sulfur cluster insertion protein|nr:iron-sulfur cluster insertion protein ErpA [Acetobacteraceae bacterium]
MNETPFTVSDRAAERIAELAAAQSMGTEPASLRVAVLAGGCSGFQYHFALESGQQPEDLVIDRHGARILVDPTSLELLAGAVLDYTDELMGSHFTVRNPNATASCGCGSSFSID